VGFSLNVIEVTVDLLIGHHPAGVSDRRINIAIEGEGGGVNELSHVVGLEGEGA
jgi:hypothetical protein